MRKLITTIVLFSIVTSSNCEPDQRAPSRILSSDITLPTITKRWGLRWEDEKPETTIEEIVQCIGNDVSAHRNAAKLQRTQEQLKAQHAALTKSIDALKPTDQSLEASRNLLQERVERFQAEKQLLNERVAMIEKSRKASTVSQNSAKSFNSAVAAYNLDVAKQQALRKALVDDQEDFNSRLATHNQAINQIKQESLLFSASNEEFKRQVAQFTENSHAQMEKCTGEKTIRK
jgi:chromosome segregation ATPase